MKAYNSFARVYDDLTENVEYKKRFEYINRFFGGHGVKGGDRVLDLACGSGSFSKLLAESGYKVTGVDSSPQMLTAADLKCAGKAEFICADMRQFRLTEAFDACICCLDSINHLDGIDEVKQAFACVHDSLKKGGLFVFDVNTLYKHKKILAGNTFVFDRENYFLSWDNEYSGNGRVNIFLDLFMCEGEVYKRYSECFSETTYPLRTIRNALKPYFVIDGVYADLSLKAPVSTSERVYFVCRSI